MKRLALVRDLSLDRGDRASLPARVPRDTRRKRSGVCIQEHGTTPVSGMPQPDGQEKYGRQRLCG
jgi:hypothetical protein